MKRIFFWALFFCSGTSYAQGIQFREATSWQQVKSWAKKEHKYIFMDVYATWCAPCKEMEKEVYTNDAVSNHLNEKFISCKIQLDSGKDDTKEVKKQYAFFRQIIRKYKIYTLPTFLFFDSNGTLVYREQGYHSPARFIVTCKKVEEESQKYHKLLSRFNKKEMRGQELLDYAIYLTDLKAASADSLALKAASLYKKQTLDKQPLAKAIDKSAEIFLSAFNALLTIKDPITKYLYKNKSDVDKKMEKDGFSEGIVSSVIKREIIEPDRKRAKQFNKLPSWSKLERNIGNDWDPQIAKKIVLDARIEWYYSHDDWNNAIKYHFERIKGFDRPLGPWAAVEVNNFIWSTVLKFSNDRHVLEKACEYMKEMTDTYPDDYAKKDTYAGVLYKLGKKEDAMCVQRKALEIAEKTDDQESIIQVRKNLSDMEKGVLTWN